MKCTSDDLDDVFVSLLGDTSKTTMTQHVIDVPDSAFGAGPSSGPKYDLEQHRIPNLPPAAFYIPNFITEQEEAYLLQKIGESPQPKWKTVGTGRRLQYWGGNMTKSGVLVPEPLPAFLTQYPDLFSRIQNITSPSLYEDSKAKGLNQVLVNEYQPGQGISPHEDGPAFFAVVATVSLGSSTLLDIHQYLSNSSPSPPMTSTASTDPTDESQGRPIAAIPLAQIFLERRSLLIISSSLYISHLHGIKAVNKDVVGQVANRELLGSAVEDGAEIERETRTSLTFRSAERVLKIQGGRK